MNFLLRELFIRVIGENVAFYKCICSTFELRNKKYVRTQIQ